MIRKRVDLFLGLVVFAGYILSAGAVFADKPVDILFFYSNHCKACLYTEKEILPKIKDKYKNKINIIYLEIGEKENLEKLAGLANFYGRKEALVPTAVCGGEFMVGRDEIVCKLPLAVDKTLAKEKKAWFSFNHTGSVQRMFKRFSLFSVVLGGLLDGINPCAFTVIVFFISFLTFYGYRKREVISIGLAYILSVFITYLLIGLGIFKFLYSLKYFYLAAKVLYLVIAAVCFILAVLSLYDYIKFRRTKQASESILQLPKLLKNKIHRVIGGEFKEKKSRSILGLFLGAMSVGFLVSLLEAVCTGQIYLPVIVSVLKVPSLQAKALVYLLIYNIMFIVPLLIIFGFALWGVTSQQFSGFIRRRFGLIRVSMTVFFLGLGLIILWGI